MWGDKPGGEAVGEGGAALQPSSGGIIDIKGNSYFSVSAAINGGKLVLKNVLYTVFYSHMRLNPTLFIFFLLHYELNFKILKKNFFLELKTERLFHFPTE